MATKTFYVLNAAATSPDWFGNLQDGGSAPAAAASAYGWTVAKISTATSFWRARLGASATATVSAAASVIAATSSPTAGTGATNTTAGDSFSTPTPYTGTFAAGNWTLSWGMRTGAATHSGRLRCRVWASTSDTGAGARELTSAVLVGSTITLNATGTTFTTSMTWNAPGITLNNEYLFFQLEWNVTTAGTSNSCTALFYQSAASITTTDFAIPIPVQQMVAN
jgi:hypothetical protein